MHYRDLAEYRFEDFYEGFVKNPTESSKTALDCLHWLHVEGRNIPEAIKILDFVKQQQPRLSVSIEIEKPRESMEQLYGYGDIVFFSRHFATAMQYQDAAAFLKTWRSKCHAPVLVCPWGAAGAYAIDQNGTAYHAGAVQISQVVDTIGAGDTFNAGFIHATFAGLSLHDRLHYANFLAGKKCSQLGFDRLTENLPDEMAQQP